MGTRAFQFIPVRKPDHRFFVVCAPRTGSELLVSLLDAHPKIRCEGEIYKSPPPNPLRDAAGRARAAWVRGDAAWGCKILDQQLRWFEDRFGGVAAFFEAATRRGWTFIHLARRDLLAQTLSALHAEEHKHHYRVGEPATFEPLTVDPADLIAWLVTCHANATWLADAVRPFQALELVYEDDLVHPAPRQAAIDRVCDALGVAPAPVTTELRPIAPRHAADRVVNWGEVASVLERTRFGEFI